jgi:gliding motility-associated lipoprotein GldD
MLAGLIFQTCTTEYSPKPRGYFYIELPEKHYVPLSVYSYPFSFDIPSGINLQEKVSANQGIWFDLCYPELHACIYCSYLDMRSRDFNGIIEDNYRLVYKQHTSKAITIGQQIFPYAGKQVYATLYTLNGDIATPLQFMITDSIRHFFRASLYFECIPNQDSLRPVINFIRDDILQIIETFQWKTVNDGK